MSRFSDLLSFNDVIYVFIVAILAVVLAFGRTFATKVAEQLGEQAGREVLHWLPRLAEWIVRRAAQRVPEDLRQRYQEEWLADLDAKRVLFGEDNPLSLVIEAVRIAFAVPRIMRAHGHALLWPRARAPAARLFSHLFELHEDALQCSAETQKGVEEQQLWMVTRLSAVRSPPFRWAPTYPLIYLPRRSRSRAWRGSASSTQLSADARPASHVLS